MAKVELSQEARDRIHREAQEMRDRVMRGESRFETDEKPERVVRQPRPPRTRVKDGAPPAGPSGRRYDAKEIVRLYTEDGLTSGQIATKLDTTRITVTKHLKREGVFDPHREGKSGRPLSDFCGEGHDQAIHRAESSPGKGDWHCGPCKLKRNAEYKKEQRAKERDNRVQTQPNGSHKLILKGVDSGTFEAEWDVAQALHEHLQWLSTPSRGRKMRGGS